MVQPYFHTSMSLLILTHSLGYQTNPVKAWLSNDPNSSHYPVDLNPWDTQNFSPLINKPLILIQSLKALSKFVWQNNFLKTHVQVACSKYSHIWGIIQAQILKLIDYIVQDVTFQTIILGNRD